MDEKSQLLANLKEFLGSAKSELATGNYNSATTLYFKALATHGTLLVLGRYGVTPKDHEERFRYLELIDKKLVDLMKNVFSVYRRSYNLRLSKKEAEGVAKEVENAISGT